MTSTLSSSSNISLSTINKYKAKYAKWLAKPAYIPERETTLELIRQFAHEHNFCLTDPIVRPKITEDRKPQVFEPEDNMMYIGKAYFDGSQMLFTRLGDNPATNKQRHEETKWDGLFDDLYKQCEADEDIQKSEYCDVIAARLYEWYCYDGDEPLLDFVNRKVHNEKAAKHMKSLRYKKKRDNFNWNYSITVTKRDGMSDQEFKNKVLRKLNNLHSNHGWLWMGTFEYGKKNGRLHFHGIVYIPDGHMPGNLEYVHRYSIRENCVRWFWENTDFRKKFGFNEFDKIESGTDLSRAASYVFKYVEKDGGKIHYSRGLNLERLMLIDASEVHSVAVIRMGRKVKRCIVFTGVLELKDNKLQKKILPLLPPPPHLRERCLT